MSKDRIMDNIKEFLEGVRKEIKKVSWPDQRELVDNTMVVMVFTVLISVFIFVVDQLYSTILGAIYQ
ncbi:preprotein translocase subunit SecE [Halalkalibaculum sp. DA3122]|uniref:preprotein translocase subunit SecE n=2 Tax=unclassified Halalkalibaculum TaxID=2964617 RepID=UPI003753EFB3